ncbi:methyltransferase family protein [Leptospira licerasiae]|uniref:methyltransferase family protein n=1 Tax=Leptospira licerasiae TaxID=447106 RepID=UPI00301A887F
MPTYNTLTRISYLIFALISYMIYLFSTILFVLRLLDATQFLKPISPEFHIGLIESICLDITLVVIFGLPHSFMARPNFKKYCRKIIPLPIERSFYVFIASLTLITLSCLWQPIHFEIWNIKTILWVYVTYSFFLMGLLLAVVSSFLIDHFELFGLSQAWNFLMKTDSKTSEFATPSLYKLVRHPMMFGMLLALWSIPLMSADHLILSIGMTIYIIIGTLYEERDLVRVFGEKYQQYKLTIPMLLPFFRLEQKIKSEKKV